MSNDLKRILKLAGVVNEAGWDPSMYRRGDEHDSRSPYYEEPPEMDVDSVLAGAGYETPNRLILSILPEYMSRSKELRLQLSPDANDDAQNITDKYISEYGTDLYNYHDSALANFWCEFITYSTICGLLNGPTSLTVDSLKETDFTFERATTYPVYVETDTFDSYLKSALGAMSSNDTLDVIGQVLYDATSNDSVVYGEENLKNLANSL